MVEQFMRPSCNGYEILETLGSGGQATVKKVRKIGGDGGFSVMKIFDDPVTDKGSIAEEFEHA